MDWLLSFIPWWAWIASIAVAALLVWRLLGWQAALAASVGLLAVLGYGKGRGDAVKDAQARTDRRNLDAVKDRKDVDDEIGQLGSNDVDERLARWLRDDEPR